MKNMTRLNRNNGLPRAPLGQVGVVPHAVPGPLTASARQGWVLIFQSVGINTNRK